MDHDLVWTPEDRNALIADGQLQDKYRCVVIAGGDGSICAVVNQLEAAGHLNKVPISTFPVGNENLFARHLGISLKPEPLVEAIVENKIRDLDIGQANGSLFTLMYSIGFDADVVRRVDRWRKAGGQTRRAKKISYARPSIEALWKFRVPEILVTVDGKEHTGRHLFVFNTPEYGGGLKIAPFADITNGRLAYVILQRSSRLGLFKHLCGIVAGSRHLGGRDVIHGEAESISVKLAQPSKHEAIAQADGDPAGRTPADVRVRPGGLRVIAPDKK